jgi:hypothetical protein
MPAVYLVVAGTTHQKVIPAPTMQIVVAFAAGEPIVPTIAEELVVAIASVDQVGAPSSECSIISATGKNAVVAIEANQQLVSIGPGEYIIIQCAEDEFFVGKTVQIMVIVVM